MTDFKTFDVAIIGAGPGGYVAAITLAQEGKQVALIEKNLLGGTCLNVGCIPTKTLIATADALHLVKNAAEFGIETGQVKISYQKCKQRKDLVVSKIRTSLESLLKANKIQIFQGSAQFESPNDLKIQGKDNLRISAQNIIIATGSEPFDVKAFPCDHKRILNSTSILELTEIPKTLVVVGGGYIGCEFASLFQEMGSKVTILEAMPSILAPQGQTISEFMTQEFLSKGIEIRTNVQVKAIQNKISSTEILLSDGSTLQSEYALVAIGRRPFTENLSLEKAGLKTTEKGFIDVNLQMQTQVAHIFAIGDVTGKSMLAHVASHMGTVAAHTILGSLSKMHYNAIPAVIFTTPEIATVGLSLDEASKKGYAATIGTFPFQAIGKAQASNETKGFSQIVIDKKTGQILGATIIGHDASNLIAEMTVAVQNELTIECIADTIHAHPTMAEIWHETALMTLGTPLHLPKMRK